MKISWKEQAAKNLCICHGENPLEDSAKGNDHKWQDYLEMVELVEQARTRKAPSVEQDPLRADFEKWLPKKSKRYSTERYGAVYGNMEDMYVSALTEELWEAWQSHFKQQGE